MQVEGLKQAPARAPFYVVWQNNLWIQGNHITSYYQSLQQEFRGIALISISRTEARQRRSFWTRLEGTDIAWDMLVILTNPSFLTVILRPPFVWEGPYVLECTKTRFSSTVSQFPNYHEIRLCSFSTLSKIPFYYLGMDTDYLLLDPFWISFRVLFLGWNPNIDWLESQTSLAKAPKVKSFYSQSKSRSCS